jgi:hypothetical protein
MNAKVLRLFSLIFLISLFPLAVENPPHFLSPLSFAK